MARSNADKMRLSGFATQLSVNGCSADQIRTAATRYDSQFATRQTRLGSMREAVKAKAAKK
jgi:hypothetical protein